MDDCEVVNIAGSERITSYVLDDLTVSCLLSVGTRGRMIHLLKEKSKVKWEQKPRRRYPVLKVEPEHLGSSLVSQKQADFNFSAALKELAEEGPAAYSKKHGVAVPMDEAMAEEEPNQIPAGKKKKKDQ